MGHLLVEEKVVSIKTLTEISLYMNSRSRHLDLEGPKCRTEMTNGRNTGTRPINWRGKESNKQTVYPIIVMDRIS